MGKPATYKSVYTKLYKRVTTLKGEEFAAINEELIELAARNKHLLARYDDALQDEDLKVSMYGSMGQAKEQGSVLIKTRNEIAKLYADNLDALQLTPRALYKKQENSNTGNVDPFMDYMGAIKN